RDAGAIAMSQANAERAGVAAITGFSQRLAAECTPPEGPPGLVIVNPPYGDRIGDKGRLSGVYKVLGETLMTRFGGWRVGLITSDSALAKATRLPFLPPSQPVAHGGLRVTLYRTDTLP
ncbi:MAG: class I SAM-dependent RNA methyltransferase, partial [Hyphomicrobiaceae bacterium]